MNTAPSSELRPQFGDIDIYLFDQLLRGRFDGRRGILDAGCGSGRNRRSCSFARDRTHFDRMLDEMWRVLAPGGLLFARLASSIGIESLIDEAVGRVRLPDGTDRFVVDERYLLHKTLRLLRLLAGSQPCTGRARQRDGT